MAGIIVKLSAEDFAAAWANGEARHRHHCERKGRQVTNRALSEEGAGTVGEMAVARLLGLAWNPAIGAEHYGSDDVFSAACGAMEVKSTEWQTGRLLIYERTADLLPVILALVNRHAHEVNVAGWITATDGKRPKWWEETFRSPCWAVPQSALRPLEELPCFQRLLSQPSASASEVTTGESGSGPSTE